MTIIAFILRLLGFAEQAVAIEQTIQKKVKQNEIANTPDTDREWSDAADRGDL